MSLAHIDLDPRPAHTAAARRTSTSHTPSPTPTHAAPNLKAVPNGPAAAPRTRARTLHAVPPQPKARGFALYVGFDEEKAAAAGTDLRTLVTALRQLTAQLAPGSDSYASVALAPEDAGGRAVDIVRLALQEPAAVAAHNGSHDEREPEESGVTIDISRKRVTIDGAQAPLTFKEFELLQYLVLRPGRTVERAELIAALWNSRDEERPNDRTVDVHVRRLRAKLGAYTEIVRTVRGAGYRYDAHADVAVQHASAPSPDLI